MRARPLLQLSGVVLVGIAAASAPAQLAGPPAGVPVPPAPMASEAPKTPAPLPIPAGEMHFRIRLLDGRSSLPVKNGKVRLWYDERDTPGYLLTTDEHGEALMPEPAVPPVRVLAAPDDLYDCRRLSQREAMPGYNLQELGGKGVIAANRCESGSRAAAHPGELTLFARPARWYEQINRDAMR